MAMDKKQQNNVALGMIGLVLAFGFYFFIIKKRNKAIADLTTQNEAIATIVETLENDQKRMGGPSLARDVATYGEHMKRLEELIPQRADVPGLLFAIAEQAQNANVAWGSIKPVIDEPVAYYSRQVYDISVSGSYHDIGNYLAGIASLRRIIKPMDLTLNVSNSGKKTRDGSPILDAKFSVETYVVPPPGELKPDSIKKGA